jgi:predicted nuclease with RNAse H fold
VGLDLASKETNPTGFALYDDGYVITTIVYTDIQIIDSTIRSYPELIAMDAPLTYSEGYREAERELIRRGIKSFPPNFIKELTFRAIKLKAKLGNVIEVFPSAFYKIMEVNENQLERFVRFEHKPRTKHELDATACCITAAMFLDGKTEAIGDKGAKIIIPKNPKKEP